MNQTASHHCPCHYPGPCLHPLFPGLLHSSWFSEFIPCLLFSLFTQYSFPEGSLKLHNTKPSCSNSSMAFHITKVKAKVFNRCRETKLAKMVWPGSLAPQPLALALCFVHNDYVKAELMCITVHACHEVLAWTWVTSVIWAPPGPSLGIVSGIPVHASPWKPWQLLSWGYTGATSRYYAIWRYVMTMLWLHYGYVCLLLQLLRQPGERPCYGCHASQERMNVSAVSTAPCIFFQLLSLRLAYPGFVNSADSVNRISNKMG